MQDVLVHEYIHAKKGDRVLDIGCGTCDILNCLPEVDYVGFDSNPGCIRLAEKRFKGCGRYFCGDIDNPNLLNEPPFDIVISLGVLHHLPDSEAMKLVSLAYGVLKRGGRVVTADGCYIENQSFFSRKLMISDRGKHVRSKEDYETILSGSFRNVRSDLRHNLLRIPYTHLIMEATKEV